MYSGADGGGRTRTTLRSTDFKSVASADFATSAWLLTPGIHLLPTAADLPVHVDGG